MTQTRSHKIHDHDPIPVTQKIMSMTRYRSLIIIITVSFSSLKKFYDFCSSFRFFQVHNYPFLIQVLRKKDEKEKNIFKYPGEIYDTLHIKKLSHYCSSLMVTRTAIGYGVLSSNLPNFLQIPFMNLLLPHIER